MGVELTNKVTTHKLVSNIYLKNFNINLRFTDRSETQIKLIEEYLKNTGQLRDYLTNANEPVFSQTVSLDLGTVVSSVSGPKRPNDRVSVTEMKEDFAACLSNKVCFFQINFSFIHRMILTR